MTSVFFATGNALHPVLLRFGFREECIKDVPEVARVDHPHLSELSLAHGIGCVSEACDAIQAGTLCRGVNVQRQYRGTLP